MWHPQVLLASPAIPAPLCIACQIVVGNGPFVANFNTSPAAVSAGAAAAPGMVTPAAGGNPHPRVRHGAAVPGHRDAVKTFAEGPIQRVPPIRASRASEHTCRSTRTTCRPGSGSRRVASFATFAAPLKR